VRLSFFDVKENGIKALSFLPGTDTALMASSWYDADNTTDFSVFSTRDGSLVRKNSLQMIGNPSVQLAVLGNDRFAMLSQGVTNSSSVMITIMDAVKLQPVNATSQNRNIVAIASNSNSQLFALEYSNSFVATLWSVNVLSGHLSFRILSFPPISPPRFQDSYVMCAAANSSSFAFAASSANGFQILVANISDRSCVTASFTSRFPSVLSFE
jgi:hypothetical protein